MSWESNVAIRRLAHGKGLALPEYASGIAAGLDLPAAVEKDVIIKPSARALIPTGFAIALDKGFEAQIRPRSGLALHHGITLLNSPGTIDADYRGEVSVILVNFGQEAFIVKRGMRIAQMIISRYERVTLCEVKELDITARGGSGFGSTGKT